MEQLNVIRERKKEGRNQGGFWPKDQNRAAGARFWVHHQKWHPGVMEGGGGAAHIRKWWWWGAGFANCEAEEGVGAKNPKPSVCGLVSGVPCVTAVWDDTGRLWVRVNDMKAAGGLRVRQREARGRGLGQKTETGRSSLGFGRAV